MSGGVGGSCVDDLLVGDDAADIDDSGAVGGGSRVVHHYGGMDGGVVDEEIPAGGGVVGFHALERVDEDTAAFGEVVRLVWGDDTARKEAAGPEAVAHLAPGVGRVCAVSRGTIGADLEAWSVAFENQVNQGGLVARGFDGVFVAGLVQGDGDAIGIKGYLLLVEAVVLQRIREPQMIVACLAFVVPDLDIELARRSKAAVL